MKQCKDCLKQLPLEAFSKDKYAKDNHTGDCKVCRNIRIAKYFKTEAGLISKIYASQKSNARQRGRPIPTYTKQELTEWLYKNGFKEAFKRWENSNYSRDLIPSVDRLDDKKSYTLCNIRLVTWKENNQRFKEDIKAGINTSLCKAVVQLQDGKEINTFFSIAEASRQTGVNRTGISGCLIGRQKTAKGFQWRYL